MGFFSALTDDQIALLGCATAFVLFGGLMALSKYVGLAGRTSRETGLGAKHASGNEPFSSNRLRERSPQQDDRKAA